jgi:hypothetical protein
LLNGELTIHRSRPALPGHEHLAATAARVVPAVFSSLEFDHHEVGVGPLGTPDPARFPGPPSPELRVVPRSTAQVLFYLANGVEVPPEHVCAGLVRPPVDAEGRVVQRLELTSGLFEVHVCPGHKPPPTAFVSVRLHGYWYYIDSRDEASKATFLLVLQLSRLNFGRTSPGGAPLLTLPAGR